MTDNKKGAIPFESAPHTDTSDSTRETSRETERGVYLPLAWAQLGREAKAKRNQGGMGLFDAVAYLAFSAWAATVILWLVEVLP